MRALLTDEQELLRDTIADMVARPDAAVPEPGAPPPPADWATFASSGFTAVATPGRDGLTGVDVALVCEQLGRHLLPLPFIGTCVLPTLLIAELDPVHPLLDDLAAGAQLAVAMASDLTTLAHRAEGIAVDAGDVDRAIAFDDRGACLVDVVGSHLPAADLTRTVHRTSAAADGDVIAPGAPAAAAIDRWPTLGMIAVCADTLGVMAGALDAAVDYARERTQYGSKIGSFQALQHLCADQFVNVEAARSVTYHAAWAFDQLDPAQSAMIARRAKVFVDDAARPVTEANIQVHGGIGITWEAQPHVRLRRAALNRVWLGDPDTLTRQDGDQFVART